MWSSRLFIAHGTSLFKMVDVDANIESEFELYVTTRWSRREPLPGTKKQQQSFSVRLKVGILWYNSMSHCKRKIFLSVETINLSEHLTEELVSAEL